jgi:transposase InsO family protein
VERERVVLELRRAFRYTAPQIATALRMPCSTVCAVLARAGENRLPPEKPPPPVVRYEHAEPGDLLHMDVKKLARFERPGHRVTGDRRVNSRGGGYDFVHVCIDDHSRVAYVEVLPDEKGITTVGFLRRAVAWFAEVGVPSKQLLTDNGTNYRSMVFRQECLRLGIKHRRTRPYTPRTNGKAERFIQTLLREWAYGRQYANSLERTALLAKWLRYYNRRRRHGSIGNVPASRLRSAA